MNTDIADIIERFPARDPVTLGGVAVLIVGILLLALTGTSFARTISERRALEDRYGAASTSLAQTRQAQRQGPVDLREELAEARAELATLLADFPSRQQATEELSRYYEYARRYNAQLVRMEATSLSTGGPEEQQALFQMERFILEARGVAPHLLRFFIHAADNAYDTFVLDNITVGPNGPAVGRADLTIVHTSFIPEPPISPIEQDAGHDVGISQDAGEDGSEPNGASPAR
jgi:hypothetical protein